MFSLNSLDVFILEMINLSYHNFFTDSLALIISFMGIAFFWIFVSILLYFFGNEKGKHVSKIIIIVLIVVYIITAAIKFGVMRPRPYTQLSTLVPVMFETDPAFPSGHTSIATAMSYILSKKYNKWYLMIIPIMVAFTRLYFGVHYPSDVIAGFMVGLLISYLLEKFLSTKNLI